MELIMKHTLSIMSLFLCTAHISHTMKTTPPNNNKPSYATQACRDGIAENDISKVQLSLHRGADVNHLDEHGQSFLYLACLQENKQIITELLNQDTINVSICLPEFNTTPLHVACQNNLSTAALCILSKDPDTAIMCDDNGDTPLHKAAYCRKKECIKVLLAARPDSIDNQNDDKETPLHLACKNKNLNAIKKTLNIIKILITNGADTTIKDNLKATPLLYLFDLLHSHDEFNTFMKENISIAAKLIHAREIYNNNNQLHLCAKQQYLDGTVFKEYVSFLILNGLNIHTKNLDEKKPIDIARKAHKKLDYPLLTYISLDPNQDVEIRIQERVSKELEAIINLQASMIATFIDMASVTQ
jgi:ankyrin repeat protein